MKGGLFQHLDAQAQSDLQANSHVRLYPKGALLFVEGQPVGGVFVLCRGRAKLTVVTPQPRPLIVRIAKTGDTLGVSALILNVPYEATAEIMEPTRVQYISGSDFVRFLRTNENFALSVMEQLSTELHAATRHMISTCGARTNRGKLARLLLDSASCEVTSTPNGVWFQLGLTHEEISGLIGSSRETVSRLLSDFRDRGLIQTDGKFVSLSDPNQLKALLT